ncbi:putative signal peptide protein [Rhodopirellula islandica]|uniref:Signal peptide protein n=1 Tax=Rhodopirellula islandica TaxID=595434 RepID=A0A0J1BF07_RHOIS|nr:BON domain-containing protein [Rhodopirellula islandica]KLU05178.1 putative signal peptide protein [Rhodopirellula islandica]
MKRTSQIVACLAASTLWIALGSSALAQQGGTETAAGGQTDGAISQGLDPDAVFSEGIQRGGAVGANTASPVGAAAVSQAGGGGTGGGGFGGGFGGGGGLGAAFGSLFGGANAARGNTATPPIRTRLRSAVEVAPLESSRVQQSASSRLRGTSNLTTVNGNLPGRMNSQSSRYDGVNVQIQDRTATLSGMVRNESDRRMTELLMRLEPGVSRIDNQISVQP